MKFGLVPVGDVLRLVRRPVAVEPAREYREIGIKSFGRGIFHKQPVTGAELASKRIFRVEPGDLVISNVFAWEGAITVASEAEAGMVGSHRFMTFVPTDGRIDPSWAAWYFRSEPGLELIGHASPGSAGRNRTLAINRFLALEIPLPPSDLQRRHSERLDGVSLAADQLRVLGAGSRALAAALPLAVLADRQARVPSSPTRLGEVLDLVREPCSIDPFETYVSIGIRSFGKGLFHYSARPGAELGKLRFHKVIPSLLAVSNIKAWEGAIGTTGIADEGAVASNRFLFFRPKAGPEAIHYFWALLLGPEGLGAVNQASPGSVDRNRTLAIDRFLDIRLGLADFRNQVAIGGEIGETRVAAGELSVRLDETSARVDALVPSAMNAALGYA